MKLKISIQGLDMTVTALSPSQISVFPSKGIEIFTVEFTEFLNSTIEYYPSRKEALKQFALAIGGEVTEENLYREPEIDSGTVY